MPVGKGASPPEYNRPAPLTLGRAVQLVKKPRRVWRRRPPNRIKSFSVGACTWQKIHLRLQVCELFAVGEQGVRAADCKNLSEKPVRGFSTV